MLKQIRLIDAFPNFLTTGGIFKNMENFPWGVKLNSSSLDVDFFMTYGQRPISPLVRHFLNIDGTISDANAKILATMIHQRFAVPWSRKNEVLELSYDPIQNYDMLETHSGSENDKHVEHGTDALTRNETVDRTEKTTGTQTTTESSTDDTTINSTQNTKRSVYAFDSDTASPESETDDTLTRTEKLQHMGDAEVTTDNNVTGKDTRTGTDSTTSDRNLSIEKSENYTLQRSGNIGVTTSQQMAQQEIELWNWDFVKDIFVNVASMTTLNIY